MNAAQKDEAVVLAVSPRDETTKAKHLRQTGLVPLELYGADFTNRHLQTDRKTLVHLLRDHGTTTLIDLVVDKDAPVKVLFRAPQVHPVTHTLLHVDLFKVNLKEKITAQIPLVFEGVSPAVEDLAGTLIESKTEVEVECLPTDLPHELTVDISSLKTFEDTLQVKDIVIPAGVEVLDEAEETIASVAEPRSEEELAALDEAVTEDVESVGTVEEKKEGEEEEGAEGEGAEGEGKGKEAPAEEGAAIPQFGANEEK